MATRLPYASGSRKNTDVALASSHSPRTCSRASGTGAWRAVWTIICRSRSVPENWRGRLRNGPQTERLPCRNTHAPHKSQRPMWTLNGQTSNCPVNVHGDGCARFLSRNPLRTSCAPRRIRETGARAPPGRRPPTFDLFSEHRERHDWGPPGNAEYLAVLHGRQL